MSLPLSMMMKPKVILPPLTWDIEIQALSSWTMTIINKWTTNILVNGTSLPSWNGRSISVNTNDIVTVSEWTPNVTFRSFIYTSNPFVSWVNSKIITMPPMNKFTTDELWTTAWYDFFRSFNYNWSLTSLPAWSFDTSNITNVWYDFFRSFNYIWSLISLPAWSFDTSNITSVWDFFFISFNYNWSLTSLPAWSFDTSNITSAWTDFFNSFNSNWKITRDVSSWISIKNITWWTINFHYWNWSSSSSISISPWNSFNYYTQS